MRRSEQRASDAVFHGLQTTFSRAWYPLQTRYQCEKRVDAALRSEGFESFSPMRMEVRRWSDRSKLVEAPLFPGYTFVCMEAKPDLLVSVLRLPGIVRFVSRGNELASIPNAEIEAVRALVQSDESFEPAPFPAVGERVRIHGGCLEGLEGVLTEQWSRKEIVVSIGAIQRSLKIALGSYRVVRVTESEAVL